MPAGFNLQSTGTTMIVKLVTNGSVRKTGFRAALFGKEIVNTNYNPLITILLFQQNDILFINET